MTIRTRQDLVAWLCENAPTSTLRRLISEGQYMCLGRYKSRLQLSGCQNKYKWVVRVFRNNTPDEYISVYRLLNKVGYHTMRLARPSWVDYVGGRTPLYAGDSPEHGEVKCRIAKQNLVDEIAADSPATAVSWWEKIKSLFKGAKQ